MFSFYMNADLLMLTLLTDFAVCKLELVALLFHVCASRT